MKNNTKKSFMYALRCQVREKLNVSVLYVLLNLLFIFSIIPQQTSGMAIWLFCLIEVTVAQDCISVSVWIIN